ncbi:MAG: hypothetical protein V1750_07325 [Acidobacteriota bacterium]
MLALLLLLLATPPGELALQLAPGQGLLYRAHVESFPKAAWVVGEDAPMSDSPQLTGRLLAVLEAGSMVAVAGVMTPLVRPGQPPVLDEIVAVPAAPGNWRAGYLQARRLAVLESLLARPAPGVRFFASVVGQRHLPEAGGLVLEVAVFRQREGGPPELVASGLNLPAGPRLLPHASGAVALELNGEVTVVGGDGARVWTSPAGQRWRLESVGEDGVQMQGPAGDHLIALPAATK